MALIRLEEIHVNLGGRPALDNLNLQIRHGEALSVLGPSGSGKTTLLKVIAGLLTPDSGHVFFNEQDATGLRPRERGVGMLFETIALYPHLDGYENIAFPLRTRKQEDVEERVAVIARRLEIDPRLLLHREPGTLSPGEQQRVALGRALVTTPSVLLMDEPLSKLDAHLRASTRAHLGRLMDEFDVTAVIVTHDQQEAIALADRIAVLREGKVEQVGTLGELLLKPRNVYVAQFVGSPPMNIIPGMVEGESLWLRGAGAPITLPRTRKRLPGGEVLAGIRPEHFKVDEDGPLRLRITRVEPLFSQRAQLVHGEVADQQLIAQLPAEVRVQRSVSLPLSVECDRLLLFDPHDQSHIP